MSMKNVGHDGEFIMSLKIHGMCSGADILNILKMFKGKLTPMVMAGPPPVMRLKMFCYLCAGTITFFL